MAGPHTLEETERQVSTLLSDLPIDFESMTLISNLFRAGNAAALEKAIDDLLARREIWPQIRLQARRFVESERTWAASVARYREVYQRAMRRYDRAQPIRI